MSSEYRSEIVQDTNYALDLLGGYENALQSFALDPDGLRILELGPGRNFGAQLILASRGAHVTLADLYLCAWGDSYHPEAYRALRERLPGPCPELEAAEEGYGGTPLRLLHEPAEDLRSIESGSIDIVLSTAVLEHVYDMASVASEMARVLRDGGAGAHQIDLRYHFHEFKRPLDHLIATDDAYAAEAEFSGLICGNRLRSIEFVGHFESAGLRVTERRVNGMCAPEYFEEALPRLRRSTSSYRGWPVDDLWRVSAQFLVCKETGRAAEEVRARGKDLLDMAAALKSAG